MARGIHPGIRTFLIVAAGLFVLRVATAYAALDPALAQTLSIVMTFVFMAVPILQLYRAAEATWTPKLGLAFLVGGLLAHAGGVSTAHMAFDGRGFLATIMLGLAQTGLMFWCVGLGALLAALIRDKNLLLPVGLILAGLDVFLVLAPNTFTRRIVEQRPEVFEKIAYNVPKVATEATVGFVQPFAHVGPADFFFLAMFFVALHKFGMRADRTYRWIVPVLLAYLFVVIFLGDLRLGPVELGMLPALLPIGAVVLLVNAREFTLSTQEKLMTAFVGVVAIALAVAGVSLASRAVQAPPPAPSMQEPDPAVPGSAGSTLPASPGSPR